MSIASRFHLFFLAVLTFFVTACAAPGGQDPDAVDTQPRPQREWDLTDLYPTPEAWRADYDQILLAIAELPRWRGSLSESADQMASALRNMSDVRRTALRLYVYASLKTDEDQRIAENQERMSLARSMFAEYGEAVSWVAPEVLAMDADLVTRYIADNRALDPFDHYLLDILSNAEHTLGDEAEAVLAAVSPVLSSPNEIYSLLVNADVEWPTVTLSTGESVTLNQAGYTRNRALSNRADRELVFDTFWGAWQKYRNSIGQVLATEVNANVIAARLRNYQGFVDMQLSQENIPVDVYDTLVEEVHAALPTLARYFRLRGRMLGIEQMRYIDIYPPLLELDLTFDLDTSRDITLAALTPLGPDYVEPMEAVANSNWLHVYPQPGKRSGAYMSGSVYDVHPYVLLNHQDDFNSMSTYAHELGHAVHTLLANAAQPFEKSRYSIFLAEIASIINEILLEEYMIANAQTDDERLFYLGYALESMRGSFFRQTMFSEFESQIHAAVESGEPLSGERMNQIYGDLLREYHGHDEGVLEIDDLYSIEWAFIPHFYYEFYVYQYATSIAGASWFAERLLAGDQQVQEQFIALLRKGGSDYPYNLLVEAGLDMSGPEPYRAAVRRMDSIMDRIEAILASRN